jgi:hypothetical protein
MAQTISTHHAEHDCKRLMGLWGLWGYSKGTPDVILRNLNLKFFERIEEKKLIVDFFFRANRLCRSKVIKRILL